MKLLPTFFSKFNLSESVQESIKKHFLLSNFVCIVGPPGCGKTYNSLMFAHGLSDAIWIDGMDNYFLDENIQTQSPEKIFNFFKDEDFFIFDNVSFEEIEFLLPYSGEKKILMICSTKKILEEIVKIQTCVVISVPLFTLEKAIDFLTICEFSRERINNFLQVGAVNSCVLQRDVRNYSKGLKTFTPEIRKMFSTPAGF